MISTRGLRKVMREISAAKGDFVFFAMLQRANALGNWDLVVAAPWLKDDRLRTLNAFHKLIVASGGAGVLRGFCSIVILQPSDPRLRAVVRTFGVDDGEVRLVRTYMFDQEIDEAIILRAREAAKAPKRERAVRRRA